MDSKKIIESLVKIANNQQKIIHKLAQQVNPEPIPTAGLSNTVAPITRPADIILHALPATVKPAVANLEVSDHEVKVLFHPGKATQGNYDQVLATVRNLQSANKLPGNTYNVKVVG